MADLTELIVRGWGAVSRWAVPVMMTLAYALLVATSETDTTGKAWMAAGLALVLTVWFAFRALAGAAALSRALRVGDTAALGELADRARARPRRAAARARPRVARGFAHLLRGEHAAALAALDEARPGPELRPLVAAARIVACVELGRAIAAGDPAIASGPRTPWLGWLAGGAIAWRDGRLDDAAPLLARVIGDIRAGSAQRAIAHLYAARIADARADPAEAARHRTAAADLAAPDAAWLRGAAPPPHAA
jgi:hypothetical protein